MNTKEEIKKKLYPEGHPVAYCTGIDDGVDESFKSFNSTIDLHKKYLDRKLKEFEKLLEHTNNECRYLMAITVTIEIKKEFERCFGDIV